MNLDEQRQRIRCQAYSIGLLLVAFCIGASGLLGWIFDIELLKNTPFTGNDEGEYCCLPDVGRCIFISD